MYCSSALEKENVPQIWEERNQSYKLLVYTIFNRKSCHSYNCEKQYHIFKRNQNQKLEGCIPIKFEVI